MFSFTSARERRLWLWSLAILVAIYATLGFQRSLTAILRDNVLLTPAFFLSLFLVIGSVLGLILKAKAGRAEIGIILGIAGVYLLLFLRISIVEERGHLIEYSVLAAFIYQALLERSRTVNFSRSPAYLALGLTSILGLLDEIAQIFIPERYFDIRDVGFNIIAAILAILGSLLLAWARRRFSASV